mmetsp:Transcript_27449/g.35987  ORF Transcript_27449/g.35987 Transcript_27449/m.35987 type:complete len:278 (-) Transcript_27449:317-1150(-)
MLSLVFFWLLLFCYKISNEKAVGTKLVESEKQICGDNVTDQRSRLEYAFVDLCNIQRLNISILNETELLSSRNQPFIYVFPTGWNLEFSEHVQKNSLVSKLGDMKVELASSNSYSHDRMKVPLKMYLEEILPKQGKSSKSNETYYLFGSNHGERWEDLLSHYHRPPCTTCGKEAALSFGVGGVGSGVAFHTHGPGFSEVLHGRKRWYLYPPDYSLEWDPDATQVSWLNEVYPHLPENQRPLECTLYPGEALYFPSEWIHATLNLDEYTVFISTFTLE